VSPAPSRILFEFKGNGSEYFRIWVVNILLSVVTLGIYSAWAKVRRKQYFYGNTRVNGAGFEYLGSPAKILKSRLIVGGLLVITGDASGTSRVFLGLPVMLTELAYFREFEREADRYPLAYLESIEVSPRRFADLMRRLQQGKLPYGSHTEGRWSNYLSTHPDMEARLRGFEARN
jgi:Zn-dependent protease with chaperone function